MQLEDKYLVLKRADIEAALTDREKDDLLWLVNSINIYRLAQGKPVNSYVVINQDESYFPDVLKLMEKSEYTVRQADEEWERSLDAPPSPF